MVNFHHLSAADRLFSGKARLPNYNRNGFPQRGIELSPPYRMDFGAVAAADRDGIVTSVDPASGATLTLNGALVVAGVAVFDVPRGASIYSATDEHTKTLLFTGTDYYGNAQTEVVAGPTGNGAVKISYGKKAFSTITSIVATGDFGTIEVGSSNIVGLPFAVSQKNRVVPVIDGVSATSLSPVAVNTSIAVLGTAETRYVTAPINGVITAIYGVGNGNGSTATATITITNTSTSTIYSNPVVGTMTYTTGYTAGTVPSTTTLNANNAGVKAGDILSVATDGAGDAASLVEVYIIIEPVALAVSDTTSPATTTTGDVRGTFNLGNAPDATIKFGAMIFPDRTDSILGFGVTPV